MLATVVIIAGHIVILSPRPSREHEYVGQASELLGKKREEARLLRPGAWDFCHVLQQERNLRGCAQSRATLAVHSFMHSLIHSIIHSFVHSFNQSIHQSVIQSINQSINQSFNQSINQSINHAIIESVFIQSFIHSLIHWAGGNEASPPLPLPFPPRPAWCLSCRLRGQHRCARGGATFEAFQASAHHCARAGTNLKAPPDLRKHRLAPACA